VLLAGKGYWMRDTCRTYASQGDQPATGTVTLAGTGYGIRVGRTPDIRLRYLVLEDTRYVIRVRIAARYIELSCSRGVVVDTLVDGHHTSLPSAYSTRY
jgi:hypothetical protein